MATLAQATADLIARTQTPPRRIGTIHAIDPATGTLTVSLGGSLVEGAPWQASSYSPVIGDRVTILVDRTAGMIATGTLSTVRVAPADQVTLEVSPELECQVTRRAEDASWYWDQGRNRTPYGYVLNQGAGWDAFSGSTIARGTYLQYPTITLPAGASDPVVAVRIRRSSIDWNNDLETALVSPVLYGHDTPLPATGGTGVDPYFATDEWRPGALTFADEVIYPLPPAWQAGLLDGSLSGLATFSTDPRDFAIFLHDEPYTQEDGTPGAIGTPGGNAHLLVTYTPAPEAA